MYIHSKSDSKEQASSAAGHAGRSKRTKRSSQAAPVQRQPEEELLQGKFPAQRQEDEEELLQGKFPVQQQPEEEELMQGKFPVQENPEQRTGSGIPESVQTKMEGALNTSLSGVNVHPNSSKATEVGALAYTQGTDIHVAPGHYNPNTSQGKRLLGHELAHVAQQMEGRVQPTGEVGGLPLNDSPALEKEADSLGAKAG